MATLRLPGGLHKRRPYTLKPFWFAARDHGTMWPSHLCWQTESLASQGGQS